MRGLIFVYTDDNSDLSRLHIRSQVCEQRDFLRCEQRDLCVASKEISVLQTKRFDSCNKQPIHSASFAQFGLLGWKAVVGQSKT